MIEKIGQVILDDTNYSGKDLYSDGVIEDEMLEIAENYPEEKWNQVIAERKSWPYQRKYLKLDSFYRRGEGSGDRFRLRRSYRSTL